jgi:hypothetical protein
MGDEFPDAQIIGTDLSPIQPSHVPPNVRFFVEDSYVSCFPGLPATHGRAPPRQKC